MTEAEKERHELLDDICSRLIEIAGCCEVLKERLVNDGAVADMLAGMGRTAREGWRQLDAIVNEG